MMSKRTMAALLAAMLLVSAPCALAQETAPLAARAQEAAVKASERLRPFGSQRGYRGVSASDKWLYQAKLGGLFLNMRMFTPDGEQIVFQEKLTAGEAGGIRLLLRGGSEAKNLLVQLDQAAVDALLRLGVTEIVVADTNLNVQAEYLTDDLAALRALFAVETNELLCVSGETQPVTVVSVDGVRRQITK